MELKLLDYRGRETIADIGDLDDIAVIEIKVVTGDEVATVIYKDFTTDYFDSSNSRTQDCFDYSYELYRYDKEDNIMDKDYWKNRKSSYDLEERAWRNLNGFEEEKEVEA